MWFQMPKGCEAISIELQAFRREIIGDDGKAYFRAPDHFAPKIMEIGGFSIVDQPPADFPEDLPRSDPLRDGAIAALTKQAEAQKTEIQNLSSDLSAAAAKIAALVNENAGLKRQIEEKEAKIDDLEDQLEDKPASVVEPIRKLK